VEKGFIYIKTTKTKVSRSKKQKTGRGLKKDRLGLFTSYHWDGLYVLPGRHKKSKKKRRVEEVKAEDVTTLTRGKQKNAIRNRRSLLMDSKTKGNGRGRGETRRLGVTVWGVISPAGGGFKRWGAPLFGRKLRRDWGGAVTNLTWGGAH